MTSPAFPTRTSRIFSLSVLLMSLGLTALLSGCGGSRSNMMGTPMGTPAPATTAFAFVANSGNGTVSSFAVNAAGALTAVPGSPFAAGAGAEFMAVDSVHHLLFVSNQNANSLSAFAINTTNGTLTPIAGSPFAVGAVPHGVAVDAGGNFVFVGDEKDNSVSAFKITAMPVGLAPVAGSPFGGVSSPFGLAINPAGNFLYVTNLSSAAVSGFQINSATGALTGVPGATFMTGVTPIGLAADVSGKFLFVGSHMSTADTGAATISTFNVDGTSGALTPTGPTPAGTTNCGSSCHLNPLRVAVHPSNKFAYATNVGANSVSVFTVNNGVFSSMNSPVAAGQHPFGMSFDPSGQFLFVANRVDNTISAFSIDAHNGQLTPVMGSPFASGGMAPVGIVMVAKQ